MNDNEITRICGGFEIPAIPALLQEILGVAADPQSSYVALEYHISRDPGVAMQLLKTVNSAYYSQRGEIGSIARALVVLGVTVVTSLVSGLMLLNAFQRLPDLDRAYLRTIWRHALASSRIVMVLSERQYPAGQDSRFVAALLQNVGHLVLARHFGPRYRILLQRGPFPMVSEECGVLGVDHATAGAYLLRSWHLPRSVVQVVENHHNPNSVVAEDVAYLTAANDLVRAIDHEPRLLDESVDTVDVALLRHIEMVNWDWVALQAVRGRIQESFELARRAATAGM